MKEAGAYFDPRIKLSFYPKDNCYVGSQKEFYYFIRNSNNEEISKLIDSLSLLKEENIFFLEKGLCHNSLQTSFKDIHEVCEKLGRIYLSRDAIKYGDTFSSLKNIPSEIPYHEHFFAPKARIFFEPFFPEESSNVLSLIYECTDGRCKKQAYECPECGVVAPNNNIILDYLQMYAAKKEIISECEICKTPFSVNFTTKFNEKEFG